uniref:pseudouridine synthase n=1 Tax=Eggerthella sinensis TaxID=242230 RepID=UPI0022E1E4E4
MSSADELVVPMRLQKFLARAGAASRRGSENLMTAGRVTVNGDVVTELGSKVDPLVDEVAVDGAVVRLADGPITLMLHKPAGFVTTMSDPQGRPTVAELVPTERYPGLFPIGRLDYDTTGLLLFSTDGELGNGLLHPKHHVTKRYLACVEGTPTERELALPGLRRGHADRARAGAAAPRHRAGRR